MLLFNSQHDVAKWEDFAARHGREYVLPNFPEFTTSPANWIIDETQSTQKPDASTERAITHLHEHYQNNLRELRRTYAILETERAARRAELEANPPQPRDIHLRVSRLDPAQAAAWHNHATGQKGDRP